MKMNRIIAFGLVISVFAVIFVVSSISVVFLFSRDFEPKTSSTKSNIYISTEIDVSRNSTRNRFVRTSKTLKNGFLGHYSSKGSYVLITPISNNKFECRGTCKCSRKSTYTFSRRIASVIRKPLSLLIYAASTIFAIRYATKYFDDECQRMLSSSCSLDNIISEVDECSKKYEFVEDVEKSKSITEEHVNSLKTEFEETTDKWLCLGYCMNVVFEDFKPQTIIRLNQKFDKEKMKKYHEVRKKVIGKQKDKSCEDFHVEKYFNDGPNQIEAQMLFHSKELVPFCKTVGFDEKLSNLYDDKFSICVADTTRIICVENK